MDDVRSMQAFDAARPELAPNTWQDALLAAQALKAGGARLGGLWLKARAGGVRDAYLDHLAALLGHDQPWVRVPSSVSLQGLTGSVDIPATALAGRVITQPGLLAKADQGVLLIPMAERVEAPVAALIGETMDRRACPKAGRSADSAAEDAANFLVVAVDEGANPEEHLHKALGDRLGLMIDLNAIPWSEVASHSPGAERTYSVIAADVIISDELISLLSRLAFAAGVSSLRTLKHLSRLCQTLAALEERSTVSEADALTAVRLCLGLSLALQPNNPVEENQTQFEDNGQSEQQDAGPKQDGENQDKNTPATAEQDLSALSELLAAVEAGTIDGLPEFLADANKSSPRARSGKSGAVRKDARRGRPVSTSRMPPRPDARPNILATLRAAAPWQLIRNRNRDILATKLERTIAAPPRRKPRTLITRDDYRYQRLRHETPSTAIFVVDASGSTALERLGETKGAIEQLLSRCYVRRDEVAMIAFRGTQAETLLSPTRSLVMAKRKLAGLPGGGPTPLAAGLERGLELALSVRRQGSTPVLVLMTDGRGNIALDGTPDRTRAAEQVHGLAEQCRAHEIRAICIDIARRPRESVSTLASTMGADLHILRHADSRAMSDLVNASLEEAHS
ncbi:MAG: VWA domain-containing protein [Labrenzia sp.]